MIVSVYYDVNGIQAGNVSASDNWTIKSTDAYAKSSDITGTVDKEVKEEDKDAAVGSDVQFTLTGTIPSYSAEYVNPVYTLKDTIVKGLEYNTAKGITITVGGKDAAANCDATQNGNTYTFAFDSAFISSLAAESEADRAEIGRAHV